MSEQPDTWAVDLAVEEARRSPCQSKRGAVIFDARGVVAHGFNRQVPPLVCDGSDACKRTCRHSAVHAEQAALLAAGVMARGRDMLHVKVVDGGLVPSGGPSCGQCSRLIVCAGIRHMWLFHEDGWRRYDAEEFHRLSVEAELAGRTSMTEAREDRLTVLAHLDMLMVDRLRAWAHNIHTYGANIRQWGDPTFVGTEMNRIAADIEAAVKIGGQMGDELAALRAERNRLLGENDHFFAELQRVRAEHDRLRTELAECREGEQEALRAKDRALRSVQALRQALESLRNECRGLLGAFRLELIESTSLTNVRVLERKVADADAALALPGEAAPAWADGLNAGGSHRFDCPSCRVRGVVVDEDGCCKTCGDEAVRVAAQETQK